MVWNDYEVCESAYVALSQMDSMQNLGMPGVCVKELDDSDESRIFFNSMASVFLKHGGIIVSIRPCNEFADLTANMPYAGKWLFMESDSGTKVILIWYPSFLLYL